MITDNHGGTTPLSYLNILFMPFVLMVRYLVAMRTKLAVELSYSGTAYIGWQPQPAVDGTSVYDVVHHALAMAGIPSGPVAAGRTDKGTHAKSTWCTVSVKRSSPVCAGLERDAELAALRLEVNAHLPADVCIRRIVDAPLSAHAMTGPSSKVYSFFLLHGCKPSTVAWLGNACWVMEAQLNVEAMQLALPSLIGTHDFRALCAVQDPKRCARRSILAASILTHDHLRFPFLGCFDAAAPAAPIMPEQCPR